MTLLERLRDAEEQRAAARAATAVAVVDPDVDVPYLLDVSPEVAARLMRYLEQEIPTFRARFAAEVAWLRLASMSAPEEQVDEVAVGRDGAGGDRRRGETDCPNCTAPGSITRMDLTFGTAWVVCPDCGFRWGVPIEPS